PGRATKRGRGSGAPTHRPPKIARTDTPGRDPVDVPEYLTDVFAAKAVDFIDRHAGGPFFLMLSLTAPHTPIQATGEYVDRNLHIEAEGARIFAAMVSSVDDTVGDVVGALKAHGLDGNTLVFFISDNGCINYMPDVICTNAPLSGGKRYQFEGGIRVPFIATWPDGLPAGRVYDEPVISLDIYPTATAAAGLEPRAVDGVNLLPHLTGETEAPPHEFLFWRSAPNVAVRWGDWKLWRVDRSERDLDEAMSAGGRLLPIVNYPATSEFGQSTLLYNLAADIGERENLAERHPEVVERMEAEFATWSAGLVDPMWPSTRSTLDAVDGQTIQLYF
ncbi:MAG: sulfatase-like hydrolase/transferase, partial [Gammaproteobacteria bacterium]|nr:sulfatase-like hydrolase/transferase [Gammaproteobacteria bacterium]